MTPEVPMPLELISGLVQGGATAVILGVVLWHLFPRLFISFEKATDAFRAELAAERAANREEMNKLEATVQRLELAIQKNTLETEKMSVSIGKFRTSVTHDLPGALHRALVTGDLPKVETIATRGP